MIHNLFRLESLIGPTVWPVTVNGLNMVQVLLILKLKVHLHKLEWIGKEKVMR